MADTEGKKSRLAEQLARVARGTPARMGFGAAAGPKVPSLLLIVEVPIDGALAAAAASAGADGLIAKGGTGGGSQEGLQSVRQSAGQLPLGLSFDSADGVAGCSAASGSDIDFCLAPLRTAPASILSPSGPRVFLSLDVRYPPHLARGLSSLGVQGFVIENERVEGGALTLEDVVRYRLMADLIAKPLLAAAGGSIQPADLVHIRDQGIEGLLLSASGTAAEVGDRVRAFRQAIDALGAAPAASRRGWGRAALVPQVPAMASALIESPEEEPDEE